MKRSVLIVFLKCVVKTMTSSRPVQYFCHQELIEELNFLQNETKKMWFL